MIAPNWRVELYSTSKIGSNAMQCRTIRKYFPFSAHSIGSLVMKDLWPICSSSPLELSCCTCSRESNLGGWDTRITNQFFWMIAFAISMLCFNLTFFYFQTFIFLWLDKEKACWSSYKYYLWWEGYALLFRPIVIRLWSFSFNTL